MKTVDATDPEKLRGGFYTPAELVDVCLSRISQLGDTGGPVRVLEPSSGDGAFIRGIGRCVARGTMTRPDVTCVELLDREAAKCRLLLDRALLAGHVINASFFAWALTEPGGYDAIVGNPPFIRYQFLPQLDRLNAERLLARRGVHLQGVSNGWIAFVLVGLGLLREGGAFSLVLPGELLSTVSAGQVRQELVRNVESLRLDLFPRGRFPQILQDVMVVSGVRARRRQDQRPVTFCEYLNSAPVEWSHVLPASEQPWTAFLLSGRARDSYEVGKSLAGFRPLAEVAAFTVATVTGANDFFTVDDPTLNAFDLSRWGRPLLARTADSLGIVFTAADRDNARARGKKAWLLDFSRASADPALLDRPALYLRQGEAAGLHQRYKCRIRSPWYRVPVVAPGRLMMPKRAHRHHRLILNDLGALTTDTVYRGDMTREFAARGRDLASGFHNSLTLLSAEIEGRTYGGGVLELVPSEVARLAVPLIDMAANLHRLDATSRQAGGQLDSGDSLVSATDELLCRVVAGYEEILSDLRAARERLLRRRFCGQMTP